MAVVLLRDGQTLNLTVTPNKVPRYEYGDAGIYPMRQLRFSKILPGTPAEQAGFRAGDEVRQVDGRNMSDVEAFIVYVQERAGTEMVIQVLRKGELVDLAVTPADVEGKGQIGVEIGSYRPLPLGEAFVESVRFNYDILDKSIQILGKLFTNEIAPKSALSGPIEIAAWSGRAARRGFKELIYMMGFLSISIGFMNLLPIPILDGGHITILLVESVLRRDLSMGLKERITQFGFMMLMTLMAVVIFFDLSKNLPGLFSGS